MRGSERREAILRAAAGLLAERAIDAVSMTDIVRVAGVSRPIVYRHFATPREVVLALLERNREALRAALDEHAAANGPVGDEDGFRAVLNLILDHFDADPAGWRLLSQDPSSDPAVAALQRAAGDELNRAVARALGLSGPPRARTLAAEAVRAAAGGLFAHERKAGRRRRKPLVDALVAVTWRGIAAGR